MNSLSEKRQVLCFDVDMVKSFQGKTENIRVIRVIVFDNSVEVGCEGRRKA